MKSYYQSGQVLQSESERPLPTATTNDTISSVQAALHYEAEAERFNLLLASWEQRCKSFPIHPSCKHQFKDGEDVSGKVEIKVINTTDITNFSIGGQTTIPSYKEYAFLLPEAQEDDPWPSDEEIFNHTERTHFHHPDAILTAYIDGAKWLRDTLKRTHRLIKK